MNIYKQLQEDKLVPGADRGLLSLIMSRICVDGKPMNDEDTIKALIILKKNTEKTIDLLKERDAGPLIDEETEFLMMVLNYLPQGATQEDVEMALASLNLPRTMKSMGPVMKALKSCFQVVDGNLVKSILLGE